MIKGRIDVNVSDGTKSFFGRCVEALKAGAVYTLRILNPTYGLFATGLVVTEKILNAYNGLKNYISYRKENRELADAHGYKVGPAILEALAYILAPAPLAVANLGYGSMELYKNERFSLGYETIQKHKEAEKTNKPDEESQ